MGGSIGKPIADVSPAQNRDQKDKLPNYQTPESPYDDLPVHNSLPDYLSIYRLKFHELQYGNQSMIGKEILDALRTNGYFVLELSEEKQETVNKLFKEMEEFFRLSVEEKAERCKQLLHDGYWSGYQRLHFPNTDNRRDPEERDVLEMHYGVTSQEDDKKVWPSVQFKESATQVYDLLHHAAVDIIKLIANGLECESSLPLLQLIGGKQTDNGVIDLPPSSNPNTNLCMFRYNDDKKIYKSTQRCMVHQDAGVITLLPRASIPGLELLDFKKKNGWIPIEKFTKENDVLIFIGQTMERVTKRYIRAPIHRVVREPATERFSIPFEMKANIDAVFHPITDSPVINNYLQSLQDKNDSDPQDEIDEQYVHPAMCDCCQGQIIGLRHKCNHCDNYDLCARCLSRGVEYHGHPSSHSFKSLTRSCPYHMSDLDQPKECKEFYRDIRVQREVQKVIRSGWLIQS